jgi:hypothetical protein
MVGRPLSSTFWPIVGPNNYRIRRHSGRILPQMALCAGQTLNTVPPSGQVRHRCQCSLRLNLLPSASYIETVTPRRRVPK